MQQEFLKNFTACQKKIGKELKLFFDKKIKEAKAPFLIETLNKLEEFSLRPGKRIRAILISQGYFLAGGRDKKEILKTSIFIELIHNFLLVHDDILDEDRLRRGKPTLHTVYEQGRNDKHYGTSMAIVAGDMMEFLGRQILAQSDFADGCKIKAMQALNKILSATAYGEMFEVELKERLKNGEAVKEEEVLDVYKTKTAFYTFVGPLQIGAILAGADKKTLLFCEKIGIPLGVAFQIKDDFDDAESDAKRGQPSLLALKGHNECSQMAKNLMWEAKERIRSSNYKTGQKEFLIDLADYILSK